MKKQTLIFLIALLPLMAGAQTVVVDGITYNLITKGKIAEVASGSYSGDIVIPETVDYEDISYKVTTIKEKAFAGCSLNSIEIPSSITKIAAEAFSNGKVTSVKIKDLAAWCNISFGSYFQTNPLTKASHLFLNDEEIHDLVIPDGVKTIGDWQFYNFQGFTSVKIPSSVTSTGKECFAYCTGIKTIEIGDNTSQEAATVLGRRSFYYCENTDSILLGNNIVEIGAESFYNVKGVRNVVIPNSVKRMGTHVFCGCVNLESVQLSENIKSIEWASFTGTNLKEIVIPDAVTFLGETAFGYCENLAEVKLPSNLEKIDYCVFQGCTSLTSIDIPDYTHTINVSAFDGCSNLKTVTLGKSVKDIQYGAFANCPLLEDVYSKAKTPPTCYTYNKYGKVTDAFSNSYAEYINLHVPEASVETYKATEPWSGFGSIVALPEPAIRGDVNGDGIVNGTDIQAVINVIVDGEYDEKADVNEDGQVNGTDIQEVINIIVNAE